jgi:trehalose 6-phosphate phosphatase
LFSRANHDVLRRFAHSKILLAFDYDGTLAPIVKTPAQATMRGTTRQWLKCASRLYPCVVISGRARRDVVSRLRGLKICRVVGNHGADESRRPDTLRRRVRQWVPFLQARIAGLEGIAIEDKGLSVAVHYREALDRTAARRAILEAARSLDEARIVGGKLAVNLLVATAPHKGLALKRQRARLACETAIYVGDDETDEDVFRLDLPGQLLSIRVGREAKSAASYYIRSQREVDRLLKALVTLREHHE